MPTTRYVTRLPFLFAALTALGLGAQSQPTFRSGVDLVQLDVVVLDRNRSPIADLTVDDFTVLEEGQARPISVFFPITLPASPDRGTATLLSDSSSGVTTNSGGDEGRLVVIAFDRSIPFGAPGLTARTIANAAVDALGPNDLAAVVRTSGFGNDGRVQDFTADRQRLKAAIASAFVGLTAPPEMGPLGLADRPPDLQLTGDCVCGLCVLESLQNVGDIMAAAQGRQKMLLFLGNDIVISDVHGIKSECLGRIKAARESTLRALDRANVTVHAIDPSGLETLAKTASGFGRGATPSPSGTLQRQANLAVLPSYTGGRVVLNTNAPEAIVPQIFAESRTYYRIGFARDISTPHSRREIDVKVKRRDVSVQARAAYYTGTR